MSSLWLKVTAEGGCKISDAVKDAKRIADILRCTISFEFNGQNIYVGENTSVDELLNTWYREHFEN